MAYPNQRTCAKSKPSNVICCKKLENFELIKLISRLISKTKKIVTFSEWSHDYKVTKILCCENLKLYSKQATIDNLNTTAAL